MSDAVAIVIPTLDEATTLPRLARLLAALDPPPDEVLVVDGGSTDGTAAIARDLGFVVIEHPEQGRSRQINRGVDAVSSAIVCVLHADTQPPDDMIAVIRRTMADRKIALAGFTPLLSGPDKVRWTTTGSRPGTRLCCFARICFSKACGCCSAITPCSSAAPISWRQAAATPA